MNSSYLHYFDTVYITDDVKADLFTHGFWHISSIARIGAG